MYWSSDGCSSAPHQRAHRPAIGQAGHLTNRLRADPAAFHPGVRDRLIEDRQPVARRTFGGAGDQRQRFGLRLDAFLLGHPGELRAELVGGNAAPVETLASRPQLGRDSWRASACQYLSIYVVRASLKKKKSDAT